MDVSRDGQYWVFKITSPVGSRENRFKIGEEYEVKTSFAHFKVKKLFIHFLYCLKLSQHELCLYDRYDVNLSLLPMYPCNPGPREGRLKIA